jgi:hypothetical protein
LAQQRAPEKESIARAIYASTTIPNRSSNCVACSPSGGNGKPSAALELIPLAGGERSEISLRRVLCRKAAYPFVTLAVRRG